MRCCFRDDGTVGELQACYKRGCLYYFLDMRCFLSYNISINMIMKNFDVKSWKLYIVLFIPVPRFLQLY